MGDDTSVHRRSDQEEEQCWLCLQGPEENSSPLFVPCRCPGLTSHPLCLARWQLQQAGRPEETQCRFCEARLPAWTDSGMLGDQMLIASDLSRQSVGSTHERTSHSTTGELPMMLVRGGQFE